MVSCRPTAGPLHQEALARFVRCQVRRKAVLDGTKASYDLRERSVVLLFEVLCFLHQVEEVLCYVCEGKSWSLKAPNGAPNHTALSVHHGFELILAVPYRPFLKPYEMVPCSAEPRGFSLYRGANGLKNIIFCVTTLTNSGL